MDPRVAVHVNMHAQAIATGADIPPELFPHIIRHLPTLQEQFRDAIPGHRYYDPTVGNASLVCVYWAQLCRAIQFGRTVKIRSLKHAIGFRDVVMSKGSHRLPAIAELIKDIEAFPDLIREPRPWLHILGALAPIIPFAKFDRLEINGFVPRRPGPSDLRLIQRAFSSPFPPQSTPYRKLRLYNLHFSSIRDILTIINQLIRLEIVIFSVLKWDKDEVHALAQQRNTVPINYSRNDTLTSIEAKNCQDNVALWQAVGIRHRLSPLRSLPYIDQEIIHKIITEFKTAYLAFLLVAGSNVHEDSVNITSTILRPFTRNNGSGFIAEVDLRGSSRLVSSTVAHASPSSIYFVCESQSEQISRSVEPRSQVKGCVVVLRGDVIPHNTQLWSSIRQLSSLRRLVIALDGFQPRDIGHLIQGHPELCQPDVRVAYFRQESGNWAGIDPFSLSSTGETWRRGEDIATDLFQQI